MKKEVIIVIIILIIILISNYKTQAYTQECVNTISSRLTEIRENLVDENETNQAHERIKEISKQWEGMYGKLAYYIEHDELEKVNEAMTALKSNMDVEEYQNGVEQLDRCIFILDHIKEKEKFNLRNIF
jgi:hypothetical protein